MAPRTKGLTVAVTGPTGTFGYGLMPLLEADDRVARVIGVARRPFDPAAHGWTKMTYRQGDVREPAVLEEAFAGADVVVHLAFLVTGTAGREATKAINVDGTLNAFHAASAAGADRFVYSSSVAAYGFHADNPIGMTEEWPTRPDPRFFYAQEKAELEGLLREAAAGHPELALYLLRPPVVLGPHAMGAKDVIPDLLKPLTNVATEAFRRLPFPIPAFIPDLPMQFIHEEDVGRALLLCITGSGPPGAYNIAGTGTVTARDAARVLGFAALPMPTAPFQRFTQILASIPMVPYVPPATEWVTAISHPAIMDCTKAERQLGWHPRYSGIDSLRATVDPPG